MGITIREIPIPIYFDKIKVVICKKLSKGVKALKLDLGDWNPDQYDAFVHYPNTKKALKYIVFIKPNSCSSVIAHEACHIVNKIFKDRQIYLDPINDESQCYLLGWVVKQITDTKEKHKKNKHKK